MHHSFDLFVLFGFYITLNNLSVISHSYRDVEESSMVIFIVVVQLLLQSRGVPGYEIITGTTMVTFRECLPEKSHLDT